MPRREIPDRWTDYTPIGKQIEGTRFICFKVPLRPSVNNKVEEKDRLDIDSLLNTIPNLGMIIDLTDTFRYYDPQVFQSKGLNYKKLRIPGKVVPPNNLAEKFKSHVQEYLKENQNNDKLIGVHCTHGVNRTGYLICNYMISEMTLSPEEAINKFDTARGHKMERENYLKALRELESTNDDQRKLQSNQRNTGNVKTVKRSYNTESSNSFERKRRFNDDSKVQSSHHDIGNVKPSRKGSYNTEPTDSFRRERYVNDDKKVQSSQRDIGNVKVVKRSYTTERSNSFGKESHFNDDSKVQSSHYDIGNVKHSRKGSYNTEPTDSFRRERYVNDDKKVQSSQRDIGNVKEVKRSYNTERSDSFGRESHFNNYEDRWNVTNWRKREVPNWREQTQSSHNRNYAKNYRFSNESSSFSGSQLNRKQPGYNPPYESTRDNEFVDQKYNRNTRPYNGNRDNKNKTSYRSNR